MPNNKKLNETLNRFAAQTILFSSRASRFELMKLNLKWNIKNEIKINVWRNHSFESLIPLISPYASYGYWKANFCLSNYDDTLMFSDRQDAEVDILWLDSSRFLSKIAYADWIGWLGERLRALRATSSSPIILATWVEDTKKAEILQILIDSIPAVYFADLGVVCAEAGVPLLDSRSAILAGTPVSNRAQLALARELACHWLPATLFPPVKAVVLDLDHTLHSGVLGEDGILGVNLTPGHVAFQCYIKSLQKRGVFIALVSRNERSDVEDLFAQRQDYPLRWDDFSAIEISWGDKADAINRIAKTLRIAADAILFVDDNPGELASVAAQLPQVHTVYAIPDAALTERTIKYYPGLWRWKIEADDTKRVQDMKASVEREGLLTKISDPSQYFQSLQVILHFRYDSLEQLSRLADLCSKTNQFNLAIHRFNQTEIAERLVRLDTCIASVQLQDRLSDSGVIAVIVAELHGECLVIEELCISCRAMGRQLEDTIILAAIRSMPLFAACRTVAFRVQHAPRNQPALDWLARLLQQSGTPAPGLHTVQAQQLLDFLPPKGVVIAEYN